MYSFMKFFVLGNSDKNSGSHHSSIVLVFRRALAWFVVTFGCKSSPLVRSETANSHKITGNSLPLDFQILFLARLWEIQNLSFFNFHVFPKFSQGHILFMSFRYLLIKLTYCKHVERFFYSTLDLDFFWIFNDSERS